jgi:predicted dehydrogenase
MFVGLDAYKKVIDNVDVVLLTTPPGFRPPHLEYAVEKGKHVFCEKPMAVDATGYRQALAAAHKAKEKKLSLVAGFCWRYGTPEREIMNRVLGGEIGKVTSVYLHLQHGSSLVLSASV